MQGRNWCGSSRTYTSASTATTYPSMDRHLKLCQHKNSVETLRIEFQRDFPYLDSARIEHRISKARTSWEKACKAEDGQDFPEVDSSDSRQVLPHRIGMPRGPCKFYLEGRCSKGNDCLFIHSDLPELTPHITSKQDGKGKGKSHWGSGNNWGSSAGGKGRSPQHRMMRTYSPPRGKGFSPPRAEHCLPRGKGHSPPRAYRSPPRQSYRSPPRSSPLPKQEGTRNRPPPLNTKDWSPPRGKGAKGSPPRPSPGKGGGKQHQSWESGDWVCPSCRSVSFKRKTSCHKCGTDRPENFKQAEPIRDEHNGQYARNHHRPPVQGPCQCVIELGVESLHTSARSNHLINSHSLSSFWKVDSTETVKEAVPRTAKNLSLVIALAAPRDHLNALNPPPPQRRKDRCPTLVKV